MLRQEVILHILRNPHGYNQYMRDKVRLQAADLIETLEKDYADLLKWAAEKGLDVTTRNK